MNEKLKKVANKISNIMPDVSNPQETYHKFINIAKNQKVYFNHLSPENYLKVVFYIWSLKKTGDFILGDKLINNLHFANLFYTENEIHYDTCQECYGDGSNSCGECGGDGDIECHECGGSGEVDCDECGGSGEDDEGDACRECQGGGKLTCGECAGNGTERCDNCGGTGSETCWDCGGTGEIETEKSKFKTMFICTWDDYIFQRCELTEDTYEPFLTENDFDEFRDDFILLSEIESNGELDSEVKPYTIYCMDLTDNPRMVLGNAMELLLPEQHNLDSYAEE